MRYADSIEVIAIKRDSYAGELIVTHNHPTTKGFSVPDIATLVFDEYSGKIWSPSSFTYSKDVIIYNENLRLSRVNK